MRLYRLITVLEMTGVSKSTLYRYMAKGYFPRPIKYIPDRGSTAAVGWTETALNDWLKSHKGADHV